MRALNWPYFQSCHNMLQMWISILTFFLIYIQRNGNIQLIIMVKVLIVLYLFNAQKRPSEMQLEENLTCNKYTLCEKCPYTEFFLFWIFPYSFRIWGKTKRKKLRIWTVFTQWNSLPYDSKVGDFGLIIIVKDKNCGVYKICN